QAMEGSIGALIVDGATELYTKQLAQDVTLAANCAGCTFPGKPLLEGTGSLYNQHILAAREGMSWEETYLHRARVLCQRLLDFAPPRFHRPKLLVLHASERGRSSTLWLWQELRRRVEAHCEIAEVSLQNGTIHDCRGCSYNACLHFAQNGSCFYGGAISETILPAIRDCDAMLFLCPNYNDAVGANITALFNRLTSLLLQTDLYDKYLYGIVVSGYSGSDLVARQLLGAMCLNKTVMLPPRFCLLQTANDLAAVRSIPDIQDALDAFATRLLSTLCEK
ncbi:MAG: NAD(P)H-dependent oxidoreductase, partial [Oscillospiraceae bacterium]|nr:NAD(P)H-dependent oxidoreductase [Oscillospiraceae bacterium]